MIMMAYTADHALDENNPGITKQLLKRELEKLYPGERVELIDEEETWQLQLEKEAHKFLQI